MRTLVSWLLLCACLLAGASTEPAPNGPPKSETDRISVDFPNEDIRTILRNVADLYELNLVVPEDLQGHTSVTMRDATWRQIFRKALYPIGYDFHENENIIRVFSLSPKPMRVFQYPEVTHESGLVWAFLLSLRGLPYLTLLPLFLVHLVLFGAVIRDRLEIRPRFAPKAVWALLVLGGGFVPLLAYWLMHHSTLARQPDTNATA